MRDLIDIVRDSIIPIGELIAESFTLDATPLRDDEITAAKLPDNVRDKLFANRDLPEGTRVAVRLNLNSRVNGYWLQTVHDRSATGTALGYDAAVTVRDADFKVSQKARFKIASRQENKFPMAAVVGELVQTPADLTGVEIRFNPMQGHLFEDLDGHAVKHADEVTVFNTRAYARGNIEYWDQSDAPVPLGDIPSGTKFKV